MQVNESDIILTLRNFSEKMGKHNMLKINLQLMPFNGTVIKVMGTFEETFEIKMRFKIIPNTVVACNKDHGLLRSDM